MQLWFIGQVQLLNKKETQRKMSWNMQHTQYQLVNSIWAHRRQIHTLVNLAAGGGPSMAWEPATTATSESTSQASRRNLRS